MACLKPSLRKENKRKKEWGSKSYSFRKSRHGSEQCTKKVNNDEFKERYGKELHSNGSQKSLGFGNDKQLDILKKPCAGEVNKKPGDVERFVPFVGYIRSYSLPNVKQVDTGRSSCLSLGKAEVVGCRSFERPREGLKSYPLRHIRQNVIMTPPDAGRQRTDNGTIRKNSKVLKEEEEEEKSLQALIDVDNLTMNFIQDEKPIRNFDKSSVRTIKQEENSCEKTMFPIKNYHIHDQEIKKEEEEENDCEQVVPTEDPHLHAMCDERHENHNETLYPSSHQKLENSFDCPFFSTDDSKLTPLHESLDRESTFSKEDPKLNQIHRSPENSCGRPISLSDSSKLCSLHHERQESAPGESVFSNKDLKIDHLSHRSPEISYVRPIISSISPKVYPLRHERQENTSGEPIFSNKDPKIHPSEPSREDLCGGPIISTDSAKLYPLCEERQENACSKHRIEPNQEDEGAKDCNSSVCAAGEEKNFSCEHCDERFYGYKELIFHRRSCLKDDGTDDEKDDVESNEGTNNDIAMETELGKAIINYECNTCCKSFTLKINVNYHTRQSESKPCYCGGNFISRDGCFDSDKEVLNRVKPHLCDICDKSFALARHLESHKLIHIIRYSIEKPFRCVKCVECFADQSSLDRHTSSHQRLQVSDLDA